MATPDSSPVDKNTSKKGRTLALSPARRLICDFLHFAQKVPTIPVQRQINVAAVREQRRCLSNPPSWVAIFTKAFALAAQQYPELRRAYLGFPYGYLYEHPFSIASIAIEREYQGEKAVFWSHLRAPETQSLASLTSYLNSFKVDPLESFGTFRRAMMVGRFPQFLRRFIWWYGLNSSGHKRAQRMGTFGVSVYSGIGAESLHPISPITSTLNYGTIGTDGSVHVRITYDHRVMDGSTVARALVAMEGMIHGPILEEMKQDRQSRAA